MNRWIITSAACVLCLLLYAGLQARAAEIHIYPPTSLTHDIARSNDGDTIVVAPGRYSGIQFFSGKRITVRSLDPDDDAIVASTIIDGRNERCAVIFKHGETHETILTGFTIIGGKSAATTWPEYQAGGVLCNGASPTIIKNKIISNYGDGVLCINSSAVIVNNVISLNGYNNFSYYGGNGISFYGDGAQVVAGNSVFANKLCGITGTIDGLITGNRTQWNGGAGILGGAIVSDNKVTDNQGGGISGSADICTGNLVSRNNLTGGAYSHGGIQWGGDGVLANNVIIDNAAIGLYLHVGSGSIVANAIIGNSGPTQGGGIYGDHFTGIISSNSIAGNAAEHWGGGVYLHEGFSVFANNTVVGNRAREGGGLLSDGGNCQQLMGNIFRGNSAELGEQLSFTRGMPSKIAFNNIARGIEGIYVEPTTIPVVAVPWGPGNIDADPLFVDPGYWDDAGTPDDTSDDTFIPGDYHLLPGSPCIDAGTNDVDNPDTPEIETLPDRDIAGVPRVIDGDLDGTATVDIGAYEYLPGDVNYDGRVNVLDLLLVRNSLGRDPASLLEARKADVNADGTVNVQDLLVVRGRLGK